MYSVFGNTLSKYAVTLYIHYEYIKMWCMFLLLQQYIIVEKIKQAAFYVVLPQCGNLDFL